MVKPSELQIESVIAAIEKHFGPVSRESLTPYVRPLTKTTPKMSYSAEDYENDKRILEISQLSVERKGL